MIFWILCCGIYRIVLSLCHVIFDTLLEFIISVELYIHANSAAHNKKQSWSMLITIQSLRIRSWSGIRVGFHDSLALSLRYRHHKKFTKRSDRISLKSRSRRRDRMAQYIIFRSSEILNIFTWKCMQLTKLLLAGSCRLLCASLPRSLRECTSARAKYKLCRLLLGQSIDRQSARVKLIVVFPARMCSIFNIRSTRVTYIAQISAPCPRPPIQVSEVILLFFYFLSFIICAPSLAFFYSADNKQFV